MSAPNVVELASRLRFHALQHPTALSLKRDLPELPKEGTPEPGLYVETTHSPGITVNGELRISILRLVSVGPEGRVMVGQLQATRVLDHPLETWRMNHYVHVPRYFATVKVNDATDWFLRVLEVHYRDHGGDITFAPKVEA